MPNDNPETPNPNRFSETIELRRLELRVSDVRSKTRCHYAKNREKWVDNEIKRLTGDRPTPGNWLSRIGLNRDDPEAVRNAAEQRIENRHQNRMGRIKGIEDRMIHNIVARSWGLDPERSR